MTTSAFVVTSNSSGASAPRQHAMSLARQLGFTEARAGQVALIASELATNLAKHADNGQILVQPVATAEEGAIEVLAIDRGPGLPSRAMRDGYSTAGSLGAGLGSIQRQADEFEIFTQSGAGTIAVARVWRTPPPQSQRTRITGISVPKPGESVCGDAWAVQQSNDRQRLIVVDGLGHGPPAADAAAAAIGVFTERAALSPVDLIEEIHLALRATRGAAVAVAVVEPGQERVRFAGVGNIAAALVVPGVSRRSLVSHNGTAGVAMRRLQEFTDAVRPGTVLVMHSDGVATHWNPESYTGIWQRDPALAAGALYRDHTRGRDDSTVVVSRIGA
jgi:anti-sigma regulatory factor (Ser/Thr protein kinase)